MSKRDATIGVTICVIVLSVVAMVPRSSGLGPPSDSLNLGPIDMSFLGSVVPGLVLFSALIAIVASFFASVPAPFRLAKREPSAPGEMMTSEEMDVAAPWGDGYTSIPMPERPLPPFNAKRDIAQVAEEVLGKYRSNAVTYLDGALAINFTGCSDCSGYVTDVLQRAGYAGMGTRLSTTQFTATGCPSSFQRIDNWKLAEAGDILVQGSHMGICDGCRWSAITTDGQGITGGPTGYQMGKHGPKGGAKFGPGGWFEHGDDLRVYRVRGT